MDVNFLYTLAIGYLLFFNRIRVEIIFLSEGLEFICSFTFVSCLRTLWLKHNFLAVLFTLFTVLTQFHYFYIEHLFSNQLESS